MIPRKETLRRLLTRLREQSGEAGTRRLATEALAILDAPETDTERTTRALARTRESLQAARCGAEAWLGRGEGVTRG